MSTTDEQIAFVNALKALDDVKMEQVYLNALRDIAEVVFDMTDEDFDREQHEENKRVNFLN